MLKNKFSVIKTPFQTIQIKNKSRFAFTLAETLITLGIIGVVAAMTIPNLMTSMKAHKLRAQFLKSYSVIQQVFKQMEADDVSLNPADYTSIYSPMYKVFIKYLQAPLDCGRSGLPNQKKTLPCYYSDMKPYKSYDGKKDMSFAFFDDGQIALQDGSLIIFENAGYENYIIMFVDLNGANNPPNRSGYDLFAFQYIDGELSTVGKKGTKYDDLDKYCNLTVSNSYNGMACAQKAKENPSEYFKWVVKNVK